FLSTQRVPRPTLSPYTTLFRSSSYFKLILHADDPAWDWKAMDYARELALARAHGGKIFDVPHDGLDAFFARGGKLLLSHGWNDGDRKSTRLNSSHVKISYAVFC